MQFDYESARCSVFHSNRASPFMASEPFVAFWIISPQSQRNPDTKAPWTLSFVHIYIYLLLQNAEPGCDDIAWDMRPAITSSDILQYLATTRTRMVARGLDVPPPLRYCYDSSRVTGTAFATKSKQTSSELFSGKTKEGLVVSPTPTKKDVHQAIVQNRKVVDTVKSGSEHHHVKEYSTFADPYTKNFTGGFFGGIQSQATNQNDSFSTAYGRAGGFDCNLSNTFQNSTNNGNFSATARLAAPWDDFARVWGIHGSRYPLTPSYNSDSDGRKGAGCPASSQLSWKDQESSQENFLLLR